MGSNRLERFLLWLRNVTYIYVLVYAFLTEPVRLYTRLLTPEYRAGAAVMGPYGLDKGRPDLLDSDADFDAEGGKEPEDGETIDSSDEVGIWIASMSSKTVMVVTEEKREIDELTFVLVKGVTPARHCGYNGKYLVRRDSNMAGNVEIHSLGVVKAFNVVEPGAYSVTVCFRYRNDTAFHVDRIGPIAPRRELRKKEPALPPVPPKEPKEKAQVLSPEPPKVLPKKTKLEQQLPH